MPEIPADIVRADSDRSDADRADNDRRRSVRFVCGGHAKISLLPSEGMVIPGKIRDLSLHGCCVDSTLPIDFGTRAEIVVRVNAASFRAVSEVKAIRGRSVAGLEFVQLSAGGKELLADLVTDLARLQAIMTKLKSVRREMGAVSFRKQIEEGKRQATMLSERFPFVGTILQLESSEAGLKENSAKSSEPEQSRSASQNPTVEAQPLVITVDLFG
ncbi:MAG: PilZ domain-containing protein [Terriglobales bacterium]|jgi:hypothetical protein